MTASFRLILIALGLASLGVISRVSADWINLTGAETAPNIAEIYILDDHVRLVLEVFIGDVMVFDALVPDAWLQHLNVERPGAAERLRRFASETLQVVTDRGETLPAVLQLVEPRLRQDRRSPFAGMLNPFTRQRVPEPPQDKRVLYAELLYPFRSKPRALTIIPPLDADGRARTTIGFIAYHKAVPIIDFRYLGAAARLRLDWDDPWYTAFENPNLTRHHKSALMSFLYIEPYEVRHEMLTRVKDLGQWMDLDLRGDRFIEVDELEPLKQRIGAFLTTRNTVRVDGKPIRPILDRTNYVKVATTGIQLLEQPERLEISTAIVGGILAYITDGMPQQVTVDWDLFTDQIQRVPASAIDPAGPFASYLTPADNVLTWTNFLKRYKMPEVEKVSVPEALTTFRLPVGSVVCLVLLVPVAWQLRSRRRHARSTWRLLGLGALLIGGGLLLYPHLQISLGKPAVMTPSVEREDAVVILTRIIHDSETRSWDSLPNVL